MIRWNYMLHLLREHRVRLLFSWIFVGLFQVLLVTLVVGIDLMAVIEQFIRQLPPQVRLMFGEQFMAQFSVIGAVTFGYNHPLVLVILILIAITIPAHHVAGEIEDGTLELLFALPVKRTGIVLTLWLSTGLFVLGGVMGCWAGTGTGLLVYPDIEGVPASTVIYVGVNLWLLLFAIGSYTLLIAAYTREGGKATQRAAGLTLSFYFVNMAAVLWPKVDFLRWFTVFYYHQPQQVMREGALSGVNVMVLSLVILVCGIAAIRRMRQRDIPG